MGSRSAERKGSGWRGSVSMRRFYTRSNGITPADAGNRDGATNTHRRGWGSPPRVRGTVFKRNACKPWFRITPACAGNRSVHLSLCDATRDHPRVCGEQTYPLRGFVLHSQSPPRVRGTDFAPTTVEAEVRITPACAGNSCPA